MAIATAGSHHSDNYHISDQHIHNHNHHTCNEDATHVS
jgi:hypothetical protein